ncbi:MAG: DNA gyrase inhibitor YacG [Gammaproteobacteria bacterium]|nr:DNA gyrase inhibitor YacG [Pseudomonadales bacterium]MCP5345576.1 DNA gyrase inhibitor YacG [Pseudomonadales bacterium]
MNNVKSVACPTCLKKVPWVTSNPYRPFCSERCKLLDLGDWASGRNVIAGEPVSVHDDDHGHAGSDEF